MKLKSIKIENYRSIEDVTLEIHHLNDNSYTFGLIGVNEAGKSSILKALALRDDLIELESKDFRDRSKPITISYTFENDENDIKQIESSNTDISLREYLLTTDLTELKVISLYGVSNNTNETFIIFKNSIDTKGFTLTSITPKLENWIISEIPKAIYWTAEEKYLISKPINLVQFANSPETISIPLKNCFHLAGYTEIKKTIDDIKESTDREELQTILGESVTDHIKKVWSNHPIKITFNISDGLINFHIKDENAKCKAKTADQRSDGFRQFVSFLLTLSAESRNEELRNTIILLDEPETHLHPKAQEDLLNELINLTNNDSRNIVFFATHSNYMVDKTLLERNLMVKKPQDKTEIFKFDNKTSTYASVNYDAFDIVSTDYHNELYGALQEKQELFFEKDFDNFLESKGLKKDKSYTKIKKDKTEETYNVTLPTKIRNIIHHPENKLNSYSKSDLKKSIDQLITLL